jgi:hypothetical protein
MPEKLVLLLGDIGQEGVTSLLSTLRLNFKRKSLNSSECNWASIVELFETHEVKTVLGKITGGVYENIVSEYYSAVGPALLKRIAAVPHQLFAYEDLLAGRETGQHDEIRRPSVAVLEKGNRIFAQYGLEILPYRKRAEVTVSAESFLKELTEGLLFRLYVPSARMWGKQIGQLLSLFKDYLSSVLGLNVRLDQQSTGEGTIYAFHEVDLSTMNVNQGELSNQFEEFTRFNDLCISDPTAAEQLLKESHVNAHEIEQIISRYSKEYRRLQVDLKHSREDKILAIRHRLESELVDVLPSDQQDVIDKMVDSLVPNTLNRNLGEALFFPFGEGYHLNAKTITLNFKPQIIERAEGVVAQEVNGIYHLNSQDKELISLFTEHGGKHSPGLTAALQELNDHSAPEAARISAKQRITRFLIAATDKIGDVAAGVLRSYIEKTMLGL